MHIFKIVLYSRTQIVIKIPIVISIIITISNIYIIQSLPKYCLEV